MKFIGFLLLFCCGALLVSAQDKLPTQPSTGKKDTIREYETLLDGELVPMIVTPEIKISDVRIFKSEGDRQAYRRLKNNIYKVLPYSK
jgi:hypothetical protein